MSTRHNIGISVEVRSGQYHAQLDGVQAEFVGTSEEEAIGLLLHWLAKQFAAKASTGSHATAASHATGGQTTREQLFISYKSAPLTREESEIMYNLKT